MEKLRNFFRGGGQILELYKFNVLNFIYLKNLYLKDTHTQARTLCSTTFTSISKKIYNIVVSSFVNSFKNLFGN